MRNHRYLFLSALVLILSTALVMAEPPAQSSGSSQVDRLLDILVRKHLLTAQEVAEVRAEAAEQPASTSAEETRSAAAALSQATAQLTAPPPPSASPNQAPTHLPEGLPRLPFTITGYGQGQWTSQPGTNSTFRLRRARLRVTGDIGNMGIYWLELDAVNSPALLDAYATIGPRPYLKFTAGQFRIPFSQESLWASANLPMVERAQVVNDLVPGRDNGSNGRDIGADLTGSYNVRGNAGVDYAFGVFNGAGINKTATNNHKNIAARFVARPVAGLSFAGDYYNGNTGPAETSRDRQGAEYRYERRPLLLMGEFIQGNDGPLHRYGWYALQGWQFSPKWQGLIRVDSFDANTAVKNSTTTIYLGGLNWLMAKNLRFQLNAGSQDQKNTWKPDLLSQLQFSF